MPTLDALGAWDTIISAHTLTNDYASAGASGTVDLGNQAETGQRGADGVLLEFVWDQDTEDTLDVEIAFMDPTGDSSDYYVDPSWSGWTKAAMDNDPATLRIHVEPIHEYMSTMRVRVKTTTPGGTPGTVSVSAKLEGLYSPIG